MFTSSPDAVIYVAGTSPAIVVRYAPAATLLVSGFADYVGGAADAVTLESDRDDFVYITEFGNNDVGKTFAFAATNPATGEIATTSYEVLAAGEHSLRVHVADDTLIVEATPSAELPPETRPLSSEFHVDAHKPPFGQNRVFRRIQVARQFDGDMLICWNFDQQFELPDGDFGSIYVEVANHGASEWTQVAGPASPRLGQLNFNYTEAAAWVGRSWRLSLRIGDNRYVSEPIASDMLLPRRDWVTARAYYRDFRTTVRREDGVYGWLLRQAHVPEHPDKRDPNGRPQSPGGITYLDPVELTGIMSPQTETLNPGNSGNETLSAVTLDCPAVPPPDLGDVFVQQAGDMRYLVVGVAPVFTVRHVSVISRCKLQPLPRQHDAYCVDVPEFTRFTKAASPLMGAGGVAN